MNTNKGICPKSDETSPQSDVDSFYIQTTVNGKETSA